MKKEYFIRCSSSGFAKMKLVIVLLIYLIQIQTFSFVAAGNFDFRTEVDAKRVKRASPTCTQPPLIPGTKYTVKFPFEEESVDAKPGQIVPEFTAIESQCNKDYAVDYGNNVSIKEPSTCTNNSWQPPVFKCKRICKNVSQFSKFDKTCHKFFDGPEISCTGLLLEGAVIKPRCQQKSNPNIKVDNGYATCREDGTWDKESLKCLPDCGYATSGSVIFAADKYPEKRGGAPWYVTIYSSENSLEKPEFVCGATLISAELVISAAHCFYNEVFQKPADYQFFYAVVGKHTSDFKKQDYSATKTYRLKKMHFPETNFMGAAINYAADIVILQLTEKVTFSSDVLPACLYWNDKNRFNPGENVMGKLSGFGALANGSLPSELQSVYLPYISYPECLKNVEEDFKYSISVDKFCAGYGRGIGARVGDSGGGLLFRDTATGLYYLRGLASSRNSDQSTVSTFTDVTTYISWIGKIKRSIEYESADRKCNPDGSLKLVSDHSKLQLCQCKAFVTGIDCDICKTGYWNLRADNPNGCEACECSPLGSYNSSVCDNASGFCKCKPNAIGRKCDKCDDSKILRPDGCKGKCPNFANFKNFDMICYEFVGGPKISCNGLLWEGTIATPRCEQQFHPHRKVNYTYATCREDGTWDKEFFTCVPDCGTTASTSFGLIAGGYPEKRGDSPWYVAIYKSEKSSQTLKFICGGTLINEELVISAAHCFYDDVFHVYHDIKLFHVIVGKATLDYTIKDYESTKNYTLKRIYIPSDTTFNSYLTKYASDIVILQLSEKVTYNKDIFPACLDRKKISRFNPGENVKGKLSGFGETANRSLAAVLLTAYLPYISYKECLKNISEDSISVDKFCAGFPGGNLLTNPAAGNGDSGGGFLFVDRANKLFHLRGVVSNRDRSMSSISTFTDVAQYMDWIIETMAKVDRKSECGCDLYGTKKHSTCNSTSGPCQCKAFVTGDDCDICKDGFWNLQADNPDGCTACDCNSMGSFRSVCGKTGGQCPCKPNVIGTQCDQCDDDAKVLGPNGCNF